MQSKCTPKHLPKSALEIDFRDRGATLRLGGGAPFVTQYWEGGHKTLFLTKSL